MKRLKVNKCKRIVAFIMAISMVFMLELPVFAGMVTVVNGISKVSTNTSNTSSQYSPYWQYWSQGASQYSGMRSSGCRVTAFAKLIKEAGYASFSNPDEFLLWGISNGFFQSTSNVLELGTFGNAISTYISAKGGSCSLVATNTLSNTSTDIANMMNYINQGYYIVLSSSEHTAYVGRDASISQGTPVILDSWSSWTTNPATSHTYTGSYDSMSGSSFEKYRVYSISQKVTDTTPPTISNVQVTEHSRDGYTITCQVDDASGVSKVQFPTWTDLNGQDDLDTNWENSATSRGTQNGNIWTFRVNASAHNYEESLYHTHVYAYDNYNNRAAAYELNVYIDRTAPVVSDIQITDKSREGYTVSCVVSDNSGSVSKIQFPTWTDYRGQDDLLADWSDNSGASGIWDGNRVSFRVNISDHNNETGLYYTHIYAFDYAGNCSAEAGTAAIIDHVNPIISNIRIEDISIEGYTVLCDVADDVGVSRVQFPTWTILNGQDDINASWWDSTECSGTYIGGNTYSYRVNRSEHKGELENYVTDIYAFDECGNQVTERVEVSNLLGNRIDLGTDFVASIENMYAGTVLTNDKRNVSGRKYNGNLNQKWLFNKDNDGYYTILTMSEEGLCLDLDNFNDVDGGNVTVYPHNGNSAQRWKIYGDDVNGYIFIPEYSVTRALDLDYSSSVDGTNIQVWAANGGTSQRFVINYLITSITLSDTDITLKKGTGKTLTAQIFPQNATNKNIIWSSADSSIASVVDGNITANAEGTTIIYARAEDSGTGDGKVVAQCTVTVEDDTEENNPSEDDPSEDDPSEDNPSEDDPSEDNPSEDDPSKDNPNEDNPSKDNPNEDKPSEDNPNEETPSEDNPSEDEPSKDKPSEDNPNEDNPSEDNPSENVPSCTHAYKEYTTPAKISVDGSIVTKCELCGEVSGQKRIAKIQFIDLNAREFTYNGYAQKPSITVKNSLYSKLTEGVDYNVYYVGDSTNPGMYKITIRFMGKYSGEKSYYVSILPKKPSVSKLTAKKKSLQVSWKPDYLVDGYEIRYSLKKNFSSLKTVKVKNYLTSKKLIKKLKKSKRYYVSVRSYKQEYVNGSNHILYSDWSAVKRSKKIK